MVSKWVSRWEDSAFFRYLSCRWDLLGTVLKTSSGGILVHRLKKWDLYFYCSWEGHTSYDLRLLCLVFLYVSGYVRAGWVRIRTWGIDIVNILFFWRSWGVVCWIWIRIGVRCEGCEWDGGRRFMSRWSCGCSYPWWRRLFFWSWRLRSLVIKAINYIMDL